LAEKARQEIQRGSIRRDVNDMISSCHRNRKMRPIEPAEISTCFRRICNRDFHDVVDKYHTPEQRHRSRGTDYYMFAVRVNDTIDAIGSEQQLLSFNLPTMGILIEQYVCSLSRILQWDQVITSAMAMNPSLGNDKRQGVAHMFAKYLLGTLDFASDPLDSEVLGVPMGRASSHVMSKFFNQLPLSNVLWFPSVREVE